MTHNRFGPRASRLQLEHLEDRTVPSTFTVNTTLDVVNPTDGKLSLREAITKANSHAGADVIGLPVGVFKIALAGTGEDANATGDFDITDAVTISGAGAGVSVIDAQQKDRVFDVSGSAPSAIKVVFAGLTIRNGQVTGSAGGILVGTADLVLRDCGVTGNRATSLGGGVANTRDPAGTVKLVRTTVARNVAGSGGGLLVFGATGVNVLTVKDSTIRGNFAGGGDGGGINATMTTLSNSTVSGNVAIGGDGGGIRANTVTLTNSTVSGNVSSGVGGGISASTQTLTNCTVSGNYADNLGGGISTARATLTSCTVSGNVAGNDGGGIKAGVAATLTNCTVSGNTAVSGQGGGIDAPSAILLNDTIAENIAHTGGGLSHGGAGTFNIRNTIVALNLTDDLGTNPDVFGTFASQGHNLIGDGTGGTGFTNGVNGDIVGTSVNPIDPMLGPLANNGGPTKTMALLAGSLAIDAGDNSILPPTDQRGLPRRKDGNGDGVAVVDIGAFEK